MDRKALRILALVAAATCLLARGAGAQPFGAIDTPTDGQTVSGIVRVSGFVLDFSTRSSNIDLLVDGIARQPRADEPAAGGRPRGLPDLRGQPDVAARLPDLVPRRQPRRRAARRRDPRDGARHPGADDHRQRQRGRRQHDQPGALRLHRHPRRGRNDGRQRLLPGRRLGDRRRRGRPHRLPGRRSDRRRGRRPRRALDGDLRLDAPRRRRRRSRTCRIPSTPAFRPTST